MKKIIILILMINSLIINAATYTAVNSGDWNVSSTWSGNLIPPKTGNSVVVIIPEGVIINVSNSFNYGNGCEWHIFGELYVIGNITVNNNFIIEVSGVLDIDGDIDTHNNAGISITNTGNVDISGSVIMDNGATLNVDGSMNVGNDIVFGSGGLLLVDGNVNIGGDLSGNGLTVDGIGIVDVTGNVIGSVIDLGPLPIELISFYGYFDNGVIFFNWSTASELNNNYFILEKSYDCNIFYSVDTIIGNGTTNVISYYSYEYSDTYFGDIYFRLKQVDFDGSYETFNIISINNSIFDINSIINDSEYNYIIYDINGIKYNCKYNSLEKNNIYLIGIYRNNKLVETKKIILK